jgi:chromosome segregation ATPase
MPGESLRSIVVELHNSNGTQPKVSDEDQTGEVLENDAAGASDGQLRRIETHADRLFCLLNEVRSITDRACDAALREAECADRIEESKERELEVLREELKQRDEFFQARELALAQFEETSKAKFAELESRIQDKTSQLNNREIQWQQLLSERDYLVHRLNEAEVNAKQAESQARQFTERIEAELTDLRLQLAKREESLAARELALTRYEGDLRSGLHNLQGRLQEAEAKLASRDRELKHREELLQAAAFRETEIGKLIEQLSSECEKLSAELCEKKLLIAQLENKTRNLADGGKAWKKIVRLVHEEPL